MKKGWIVGIAMLLAVGGMLVFLVGMNQPPDVSLSNEGIVLGDESAPVKVVEFTSFSCSFCKEQHELITPALKELIENGTIQYVLKHVPLGDEDVSPLLFHTLTEEEALKQMTHFFDHQEDWQALSSTTEVMDWLQLQGYTEQLDPSLTDTLVQEANAIELASVPTLFINNKRYEGVHSYEQFVELVETASLDSNS